MAEHIKDFSEIVGQFADEFKTRFVVFKNKNSFIATIALKDTKISLIDITELYQEIERNFYNADFAVNPTLLYISATEK